MILYNTFIPLYGLPCAQPTAELFLAIAAVVMLRHIFKTCQSVKVYEEETT